MFSQKNFLGFRVGRLIAGTTFAAAILSGGAYAIASAIDTVVTSTANTNLSTTGGVPTTILSLTLPGSSTNSVSYVLSSYGDLVNFGQSDYTRCAIRVNGNLTAAVATLVGDPSTSGNEGPAGFLSTFALAGGVTIHAGTASESAILECAHDNTNGATPYVDQSASLVAHRAASLKVITEP